MEVFGWISISYNTYPNICQKEKQQKKLRKADGCSFPKRQHVLQNIKLLSSYTDLIETQALIPINLGKTSPLNVNIIHKYTHNHR